MIYEIQQLESGDYRAEQMEQRFWTGRFAGTGKFIDLKKPDSHWYATSSHYDDCLGSLEDVRAVIAAKVVKKVVEQVETG